MRLRAELTLILTLTLTPRGSPSCAAASRAERRMRMDDGGLHTVNAIGADRTMAGSKPVTPRELSG